MLSILEVGESGWEYFPSSLLDWMAILGTLIAIPLLFQAGIGLTQLAKNN